MIILGIYLYFYLRKYIEPGQACLALLGHLNKSHFLGPGRPNEMGVYGIKQQLPMVKSLMMKMTKCKETADDNRGTRFVPS